jgi:DNA-binding IscR family transcriptional regulator
MNLAVAQGVSLADAIAADTKIPRKFLDAIPLELSQVGILSSVPTVRTSAHYYMTNPIF